MVKSLSGQALSSRSGIGFRHLLPERSPDLSRSEGAIPDPICATVVSENVKYSPRPGDKCKVCLITQPVLSLPGSGMLSYGPGPL